MPERRAASKEIEVQQGGLVVSVPCPPEPAFPDACPICGGQGGAGLKTIVVGDENSVVDFCTYGFGLRPSEGARLEVPVHHECAVRFRNMLLLRAACALSGAVLVAALAAALAFGALAAVLAALAALGPLLYPLATAPMPVEFGRSGSRCTLVFRNRVYAREFARLNDAAAIENRHRAGGSGSST